MTASLFRLLAAFSVLALSDASAAMTPADAATAPRTQFGVYDGAGCSGRAKLPAFEAFAGRGVERTVDALNNGSWKAMDDSIDWIVGCWKGSGVALTLSVPLVPWDGRLADVASGAHDAVYLHAARTLVADGYAAAVVRIGWEFNGDWFPWAASRDPAAYVAGFRRVVKLMRSVPGARFRFDWCPNHGRKAIDPDKAYPGDDVVDVVGMDVYDETWNAATRADPKARFDDYVAQPFGLRWHAMFARAHGKPIAYDEWGTGDRPDGHGGGDDPVFIRGMAGWFVLFSPIYQSYWDFPSKEFDTALTGGARPLAAAAYRQAFARHGMMKKAVGATPATGGSPPTPTSPTSPSSTPPSGAAPATPAR